MYTDPELFDPQQFDNDLKHSRSELAVFRNALKQGHEVLKERFEAQKNAINYVTQRAWLVDQILQQVWQQCIFPGINYRSEKNEVSLIAVGGYGRGELHPRSDVDLLILLKNPMDADIKECIEHFVRLLWDIRLEVGHSVRTLAECEQEADADITVVTNLMEARLLVGSEKLFDAMRIAVAPDRVWTHQAFFAAKLEEQNKRETKYDDTANNLEPNLKECPGGLRDIQTIGWVAKRYFGAKILYDLVQHGFLTEKEYQALSKGQEFLWELRCLLHLSATRKEERLLFDHQHTLAKAFGYEDDKVGGLAVEKLMKRYYRTVKEIRTLNEMLLQLFQEAILYAKIPATVRPLNKRFQIRNNFIEVTHHKVFVNYPFALLEIFLLMSHHPEIKGIRATTIRWMIHYEYLIDDTFRQDLRARSLFWEIFRQPAGLTHALRRMNRYGILAAYLPAFGRIVGQMQYDLFHVYTVDQHSLFVVRNLRRLSMPEFSHEFPFCSELIQLHIPKPELLYLAGLFHDIAKGRGGDHSKLGETDILDFCHAHGLYDKDARLVAWLVRNHLLMSITAQRQDISDPDVIKAFAQLIEDNVRLNYLYLLTVADIRATNSNLWTSWKNVLLTDFYRKTREFLLQNQEQVLDKQRHILEIQKNTQRLLTQQSYDRVTTLWKELGDEYFLYSSAQDVARETQIILNHNLSDKPVVLERQTTRGGTGIIVIDTKGCDYLFADTTYFFEQHNLTVVDAYIIPSDSKYTISGYTVIEDDGTEITPKERIDEILHALTQALSRDDTNAPFYPINRRIPGHLKHFPERTRVNFTQDHINNHTTVQVITTDRPGVLSRIAQAFLTCQIRVKKAKIATFGTRVEDVFFVTDYENHALYSTKQLDCLRDKLAELLDEDLP